MRDSSRVRFHMAVDTPDSLICSGYSYETDLENAPKVWGNAKAYALYEAVRAFVENFVQDPINGLVGDMSDLDGRYQCQRKGGELNHG